MSADTNTTRSNRSFEFMSIPTGAAGRPPLWRSRCRRLKYGRRLEPRHWLNCE